MSAKEQLLRGVLGCLVNKEKRKGKGKKFEGVGEHVQKVLLPKGFTVINLLLFFLTEERSRAFFCLRAGAVKGISLFFLGKEGRGALSLAPLIPPA